ncbi:MAG TPA: M20/M25/M40 family metallo-hydrolase [Terriglobales bacterium]|nr:M20/M25/M40 family metallo-hydrolase [Terriglobales bacterium]
MDVVALTRTLVDIESVTEREGPVGRFLLQWLRDAGWDTSPIAVTPERLNVFARPKNLLPSLIFCTHMDTVPPFIPSSEDAENVYGRGACDAKGIMAAQIMAAGRLRDEGVGAGLLFTVGEERDSIGAKAANQHAPGSRFLIDGEPTQNRLAIATKGVLNMRLQAHGKMAHSAYPEQGESAIDKLVEALARLRAMELPQAADIGACTMNIGTIAGGRAPNVIADEAHADVLYRMVTASDELKQQIRERIGGLVEIDFGADSPFLKLRTVDGVPTMVASFSTDIPHLRNWGEPLLIGPGSIQVAHTEREFVAKKALQEAVELYCGIGKTLLQG